MRIFQCYFTILLFLHIKFASGSLCSDNKLMICQQTRKLAKSAELKSLAMKKIHTLLNLQILVLTHGTCPHNEMQKNQLANLHLGSRKFATHTTLINAYLNLHATFKHHNSSPNKAWNKWYDVCNTVLCTVTGKQKVGLENVRFLARNELFLIGSTHCIVVVPDQFHLPK